MLKVNTKNSWKIEPWYVMATINKNKLLTINGKLQEIHLTPKTTKSIGMKFTDKFPS